METRGKDAWADAGEREVGGMSLDTMVREIRELPDLLVKAPLEELRKLRPHFEAIREIVLSWKNRD